MRGVDLRPKVYIRVIPCEIRYAHEGLLNEDAVDTDANDAA